MHRTGGRWVEMLSEPPLVIESISDGVADLRIDNGPLNLLTMAVRSQLVERSNVIAADRSVRAVVLTGSGQKAFSAGSDITEFPTTHADGRARARAEHDCCDRIAGLPQPVIAAMVGHVLGGGLELALACDIRVASPDTTLAVPESRLGLFPSAGGTQRLQRTIGAGRAKWMMLTGDRIDGRTAYDWGLVDLLADDPRVMATTIAATIARGSWPAIKSIKRLVDLAVDEDWSTGSAAEIDAVSELFAGSDAREGVLAFRQKRAPRFGREIRG